MNALTILSEHPFVAEVSDCLTCGAALPEDWPTIASESPKGTARYRICSDCALMHVMCSLAGGELMAQWEADLMERLRRLGEEIARNAMILATAAVAGTQ
jgi:hypothetical protein